MRWSCLVILTVCCLLALPELVQCCCQGDDAPTTDKPKLLHPIVFVPDIGGNMIHAKIKSNYDDGSCKHKSSGVFPIYAKYLDPDQCVIDMLRLRCVIVDIIIVYFGSMESVNYVSPLRRVDGWFSTYYEPENPDSDYAIHFTNKMNVDVHGDIRL